MKPPEMNRLLLDAIPALGECYRETRDVWEGEEPDAHIVYGDCLGPALRLRLEGDAWDADEFVHVAFDLLEALLQRNEDYAEGVVVTSVLDHLGGSPVRERAWARAGERTRQFLAEWRKWQK